MRTKLLTQREQILKGLKLQHDRINLVFKIHRLIILKEVTLGKKSFKNLKFSCSLTDGNLASHLRVLEIQGLIHVIKEFENRYPKTSYTITNKGQKLYDEIEKYIKVLLSTKTLK